MVAVPTAVIAVPDVTRFFKNNAHFFRDNNLLGHVQSVYPGTLSILPCLLLLTFLTISLRLAQTFYSSSVKSFPGPFCSNFTDIWRYIKTAGGQAHLVHADLHRKYGAVVRIGPNTLSISDPSLLKTIYNTKNPWKKVSCLIGMHMSIGREIKCYCVSRRRER
jgi:hypothetical protein